MSNNGTLGSHHAFGMWIFVKVMYACCRLYAVLLKALVIDGSSEKRGRGIIPMITQSILGAAFRLRHEAWRYKYVVTGRVCMYIHLPPLGQVLEAWRLDVSRHDMT